MNGTDKIVELIQAYVDDPVDYDVERLILRIREIAIREEIERVMSKAVGETGKESGRG